MVTRDEALLTHGLLLGERLHLFAVIRLLVAICIMAGGVFATYVVGIQGLPLGLLALCAGFLVAYDIAVFRTVRSYRKLEVARQAYRHLVRTAHATILIDYLVLTVTLWLVGGSRSPFVAFYILHAMLASVLLTRRAAGIHAAIGYLLLVAMALAEWHQIIPIERPLGAVLGDPGADFRPVLTILLVHGVLTMSATALMTGIAEKLRDGERRLRETSEDLNRLANLRRSFLHVALHDLKSPVHAVITLLDNLAGELGGPLSDQQKRWLARADVRLRGQLDLLRDLAVLGELETGRLEGVMETLDLGALVRAAVEDHLDLAQEQGLSLRTEISPELSAVRGLGRLLSEAVVNYLTNAIKYVRPQGNVIVRVSQFGLRARVEVADDGPGIAPEKLSRLFGEFVRLKTDSSRGQSVPPGSGLGLSIVRRIAEAHGGEAGVSSEQGRGSTFYFEVPVQTGAPVGAEQRTGRKPRARLPARSPDPRLTVHRL